VQLVDCTSIQPVQTAAPLALALQVLTSVARQAQQLQLAQQAQLQVMGVHMMMDRNLTELEVGELRGRSTVVVQQERCSTAQHSRVHAQVRWYLMGYLSCDMIA